jgi:AcrR family transcriptional regulator
MPARVRPYHHGDLHRALIDAAVAEIDASSIASLSLREIARRAGVSHAAPAHHFGDKAGLFTAIAIEGFGLLRQATSAVSHGPDGLLLAGIAYVEFAIGHRAYFEVMYRPELYRPDEPDLITAREASFAVLYTTARQGAGLSAEEDVTGLALAAWSVVHGFANLWLTENLRDNFAELQAAVPVLAAGVASLGQIIGAQTAISPAEQRSRPGIRATDERSPDH